jgi:hypothetical protein
MDAIQRHPIEPAQIQETSRNSLQNREIPISPTIGTYFAIFIGVQECHYGNFEFRSELKEHKSHG